jgi:hypothetical protein
MRRAVIAALGLAGCAGAELGPTGPARPAGGEVSSSPLVSEAANPDELEELTTPGAPLPPVGESAAPPAALPSDQPEVWLKGSTHVHSEASGDSSEPSSQVVGWYEQRHYDFIVLTDHNRVSELDATTTTRGQVTLRDPGRGMLVFSGIELTHNPVGCLPVGDPSGNCRIHVNLIGPTARPIGRLEWAERKSHYRIDMYRAALAAQASLGGLAQINHPQWLWGMTPDLMVELSRRGVRLFEIANSAFAKWNAGDAVHPSMEALWDAALARGATVWGTASDDAHDYGGHGRYPPGTGWIVVRARRDPGAILDALTAGRFYASTGVVLERAEADAGELVVAVDPAATGRYTIDFIENGKRVASVAGRSARRAQPATGYVRAVVTRDDGKRAWVQPTRR